MAATAIPIRSAIKNLSVPFVIVSCVAFEKKELVKAPTHIKPACPRLNSPRIPTTRLSEMARMI